MMHKKITLPNGLRIMLVPIKGNPTVTVMVSVEAGSKYETKDINGLSHFLEHMCFKGTIKRPTSLLISQELDGIGAQYNAFTSQEYTGYYAKADARHLDLLLDVVSDVYLNSTLPVPEMEKEKGVIIEEINMYEDNPQRNIFNIFMALVYGDQPAGWNITGLRENVRRFVQKDFLEYRKKHYVAKGTVVTIAGDIDVNKIEKKIRVIFGDISTAKKHDKLKTKDTQAKPAIKVTHKDIDQAHMVIGVRSFDLYDKHIPTLSVMQAILSGGMSGRLWHRFREELGICYYVHAFSDTYTDHGIFGVWAGVDKDRVDEAIREVCKTFKRLSDEPISKEELKKVKDGMIGRLYLGLESSDDQAMFYGSQEIHHEKLKDPKDMEKEIEKVSAKDIQNLARKIFTDKILNCAIIGPFKDDSKFSKHLTFGA